MERELDLEHLLRVLDRYQVAHVLIGGMAAVAHGSSFPTEDVDSTPSMTGPGRAALVVATS